MAKLILQRSEFEIVEQEVIDILIDYKKVGQLKNLESLELDLEVGKYDFSIEGKLAIKEIDINIHEGINKIMILDNPNYDLKPKTNAISKIAASMSMGGTGVPIPIGHGLYDPNYKFIITRNEN